MAYLEVKDYDNALKHALLEYNRRPQNIDVNETLAWVYYNRGEYQKALPYMQVTGASQERLKNVGRGLPYVIDLMALAMGAGLDFPGAVRQVVDKSSNPEDPIVEEFTLILQTLNLGRTRRDALEEFARRCPCEAVTEFVNSLVQAEERGNPVAEVLSIQATVSRTRRSVRAEEMAAKAGVKLVGPLMLVFFCVMGLLLGPALMKIGTDLN